jgi:F0F1-type ATP synthase membrane subunit b/b'
MMYLALTQALKANEGTSKIVSYILVGITALILIAGLSAKRAGTRYMNKIQEQGGVIDEATKELEKYTKELEKAAKELEKEAEEAKEEIEEAVSDSTSS